MKIAITCSAWHRHYILQLWGRQINVLRDALPQHEIIGIVAGSEGEASRSICEKQGLEYTEAPNDLLGRKCNIRTEYALQFDWDMMVLLGSDDLVSVSTLKFFIDNIRHYDVIHSMDLYYYDKQALQSWYCWGYINHRKGEPMAVGRVMSRRAVEALSPMWNPRQPKNTDKDIWNKIRTSEFKQLKYWQSNTPGCYVVDIKTPNNLTPITANVGNKRHISDRQLMAHYPTLIKYIRNDSWNRINRRRR